MVGDTARVRGKQEMLADEGGPLCGGPHVHTVKGGGRTSGKGNIQKEEGLMRDLKYDTSVNSFMYDS